MRVLVRNCIYDSEAEPILVIFDEEDKEEMKNIPGWATKYLAFPEDMSEEQAQAFLNMEDEKC